MHEPPESPPNVPYQAYRSKRHSRNVSNSRMVPNVSPPPSLSRPATMVDVPPELNYGVLSEKPQQQPVYSVRSPPQSPSSPPTPAVIVVDSEGVPNSPSSPKSLTEVPTAAEGSGPDIPPSNEAPNHPSNSKQETSGDVDQSSSVSHPTTNGNAEAEVEKRSVPQASQSALESIASSSTAPPTISPSAPRKVSTFRRVPRTSRSLLPTSPLAPQTHSRTVSASSLATAANQIRHSMPPASDADVQQSQTRRPSSVLLNSETRTQNTNRLSISSASIPYEARSHHKPSEQPPLSPPHTNSSEVVPRHSDSLPAPQPHHAHTSPPPRTSLHSTSTSLATSPATSPAPIAQSLSSSPTSRPTSAQSQTTTQSHQTQRSHAPYRPGFQPKGLYRPRTDEFLAARRLARDGSNETGSQKRVERTKLERRLEKIIALHFPESGQTKEQSSDGVGRRPAEGNNGSVRWASSFFDLDFGDLKRMSFSDAGDLWKGVWTSGSRSSRNDVRAAEQRITPWQEDASVSRCPLCTASFHPLTNRKHHCRLCGQIICALPVKRPQRPELCSILFVVEPKTRLIEEVGEGVDYGVKKRRGGSIGGAGDKGPPGKGEEEEEEKFLKGVRICRECRPVLLRQQYLRETAIVPSFAHLYDVFIALEREIEDSLPQFEELLLGINQNEQLTKEAAVARKRILEVFAQYDALSKRIRKLPCKPGSSQDRVQMAVMTRANVFLQKHMFPLQSLPKPKSKSEKDKDKQNADSSPSKVVDPDSEVALALQPLLEQEALLESFVEEATAHRKFEDAKTLRANLKEIRAEIERILSNAEAVVGSKSVKA